MPPCQQISLINGDRVMNQLDSPIRLGLYHTLKRQRHLVKHSNRSTVFRLCARKQKPTEGEHFGTWLPGFSTIDRREDIKHSENTWDGEVEHPNFQMMFRTHPGHI